MLEAKWEDLLADWFLSLTAGYLVVCVILQPVCCGGVSSITADWNDAPLEDEEALRRSSADSPLLLKARDFSALCWSGGELQERVISNKADSAVNFAQTDDDSV